MLIGKSDCFNKLKREYLSYIKLSLISIITKIIN